MQRQQGFSLIEVLITMLVVAVGMLGIAAIMVTSLKNNQSAYARGQATILAGDIVDRMRANRTAAQVVPSPYNVALGAAPAGAGVALTDLQQWRAAVVATMPSGTSAVAFDAVSGNVTVTMQWDDSRGGKAGPTVGMTAQQFVMETHL